jgi:hypothetical protein
MQEADGSGFVVAPRATCSISTSFWCEVATHFALEKFGIAPAGNEAGVAFE